MLHSPLPEDFNIKFFTPLRHVHIPKLSEHGIIGLDTETDSAGNTILVATSDGDFLYDNGKPLDTYEILEFILRKHNKTIFFFNMRFDYDAIMKGAILNTSEELLQAFRKNKYIVFPTAMSNSFKNQIMPFPQYFNKHSNKFNDYLPAKAIGIRTTKGKYLQISKHKDSKKGGTQTAKCYDVSNFFNLGGLDETAKKLLGTGKGNLANEEIAKKGFDINASETIPSGLLIQRCTKDAELTEALGKLVVSTVDTIAAELHYPAKEGFKYISSANITKQIVLNTVPDTQLQPFLNYDKGLIINAEEYAAKTFHGGIFMLTEKGLHEQLDQIDIASAYPNVLRTLPSLEGAHILYTSTLHKNANFGFYRVKAQYNGYFPIRTKKGNIYPYTESTYSNYLTKEEVLYLQNNGYKCEVLDGYEIYLPKQPRLIFKPFIDTVYALKSKYKESYTKTKNMKDYALYYLTKLLMNSLYGATAEKNFGTGKLTNFIYASIITSRVRLYIQNTAKRCFSNVVEIDTDSITGTLKPEYKNYFPTTCNALGQFETDTKHPANLIMLATGLSVVVNEDKSTFYKKRGFGAKETRGAKIVKAEINITPTSLEIDTVRPVHALEAIVQKNTANINKFVKQHKSVKFEDIKRDYEEEIDWAKLVKKKIASTPLGDYFIQEYLENSVPEVEIVAKV